jgi:enamine deaminase RidA (YjgF/YER057c/UK114 family)
MERKSVSSGTHWEGVMGYARAVRAGDLVFVSGTTATDASGAVVGDDYATQTRYIIEKIEQALQQAGASLRDVVRTRVYVVDESQWEQVAVVHGEFFGDIRPANTLVEVSALVGTGYLVEIEADAVIGAGDAL